MLNEIYAIIWKELREIFVQRTGKRSNLFSLLVVVGLMGIFVPYQAGIEWLSSPVASITAIWVPMFMTIGITTNAIAGERERHTLETLLASRLSDVTILLGKILSAVFYGWFLLLFSLALGLVTVNVLYVEQGFLFYDPVYLALVLVGSFLFAFLFSSIGVLVSLHAETARQAYQRLSLSMTALVFIPMIVIQFLPEDISGRILYAINHVTFDPAKVIPIVGVVVIALDVILFGIARMNFRRQKLILD
ncbi:MAG: ABC transporter permease [Anaerolineaceae bacterium]|nr:ABC transporter permease [Anaerolineaceae bacterium]